MNWPFGPMTARTRAGLPNRDLMAIEAEPTAAETALSIATLPARAAVHAGQKGLGVVTDTWDAWKRMVDSARSDPQAYRNDPSMAGNALEVAGAAMTGGLGLGVAGGMAPRNALGSAGGRIAHGADDHQAAIQRAYDKVMEEARTRFGGDTNKADWSEYLGLLNGPKRAPAPAPAAPLGPSREIGMADLQNLTPDQLATLDQRLGLLSGELTPDAISRGLGQEWMRRSHAVSKGHSASNDARNMDMLDSLRSDAKAKWEARVANEFSALSEAKPGSADAWRKSRALDAAEFADADVVPKVAATPAHEPHFNAMDESAIRGIADKLGLYLNEVSPRGLELAIGQERMRISHAATKGESARVSREAWGGGSLTPDYAGVSGKATSAFDAKVADIIGAASQPQGIRAYHGSPHDFDKFDLSKIGTGEGAQAYGHGLYFAESEGVAKNYRDVLGQKLYNGSKFNPDDPASIVGHHMNMAIQDGFVGDEAKEIARHTISRKSFNNPKYAKALAMLDGGQIPTSANTGRMYEVRINAHPDQFLDWDKPLSQQSEKVRELLGDQYKLMRDDGHSYRHGLAMPYNEAVATAKRWGWPETSVVPAGPDVRVGDLIGTDGNKTLADRLRDAGIPGIKYLDQGSRTSGEGSRNFVVFDDKIIDIVKKYGIAAAAAMYGWDAVNKATGSPKKQSDIMGGVY
jgi:hypothetical protein